MTAALLAALLLSAGPVSEPPDPRQPTALLLGDSNMYGSLGHRLSKTFRGLGYRVKRRGKPGSGLARPDFWDWTVEGPRLAQRYAPRVVVIIFGGNDVQRMRDRAGVYADGITWDSAQAWRAEYRHRLDRLLEGLAAGDPTRRVFLLAPTNRRPRRARERVRRIVELQREAAAAAPQATWVDTFALSSGPDGRYLAFGFDRGWKRVDYRKRDGVHLTKWGATVLTDAVMGVVLPTLASDR